MLKNLFSSNVRIAVLKELLLNPDKEYYVRKLAHIIHVTPSYTNLELKNLLEIELVTKHISGNQHLYKINKNHQLYEDLKNIFLKTVGLRDVLDQHLSPFKDNIDFAFVYGSMAKGNYTAESDVDLMLIGNVNSFDISEACSNAEDELKRQINYSVFTLKDIKNKLSDQNHFFTSLMSEKKLFIIGHQNEFQRIASKAQTA